MVVYCHSKMSIDMRFLFRAQDHNMTNGDFAFFAFSPRLASFTDKLRTLYSSYVDDPKDLQRRQRAFYAVKPVLDFSRYS